MENIIDKELEEKILKAETLEDVVTICAEKGLEVTVEQLKAELALLKDGELDENALDAVSGGIAWKPIIRRIAEMIGGPIRPLWWK